MGERGPGLSTRVLYRLRMEIKDGKCPICGTQLGIDAREFSTEQKIAFRTVQYYYCPAGSSHIAPGTRVDDV